MSWDICSKLLVKECPQDLVTYLAPGARFVRMREAQFQTRNDGHFEPHELRGDGMIEAERAGKPFLINIEWQTTKDDKMDERLLHYSCESTRLHELPVLSCVIYVKKVSKPPQPPLDRVVPDDFRALWFNYQSIELAEKSVEELRQLDLDGLRPLMLLCKDGATREVLEDVLQTLQSKQRGNLLSLTRFFAGMVFTKKEDKVWLKRRFEMLDQFLWENSWTYRDVVAKGLEQGLEQGLEKGMSQGLEKGLEQGEIKATYQYIEATIQTRFPGLLSLAKGRLASLNDLATLRELFMTALTASSPETVEQSLLALP